VNAWYLNLDAAICERAVASARIETKQLIIHSPTVKLGGADVPITASNYASLF